MEYKIIYDSRFGVERVEWIKKDELTDRLKELMSNFCNVKLVIQEGYEY